MIALTLGCYKGLPWGYVLVTCLCTVTWAKETRAGALGACRAGVVGFRIDAIAGCSSSLTSLRKDEGPSGERRPSELSEKLVA